jgi:hypothetical protein
MKKQASIKTHVEYGLKYFQHFLILFKLFVIIISKLFVIIINKLEVIFPYKT